MNRVAARTPAHLWVVAIIALLWNAMGAFDYTATQYRMDFYMSQFTPQQLDYFYGFPAWAIAAWAVAVWGAVAGSVALLLRHRAAVWLFGAALVAVTISFFYNFVLSDGMAIMGTGGSIFSGVIWLVSLGLFFYARAMATRGVLR